MPYADYLTAAPSDSSGFSIITNLISLAVCIIVIVAEWKLFQKAGRPGWAALIPFYNTYVMFDIVYGKGIKFLTLLIPFYNIYVLIKLYLDLAKCYGYPPAFGVGILFLNVIFLPMMAFSDSEYQGIVS